MSKTICQTVVFRNTTPENLYRIYMDSKMHGSAIGGKVSISSRIGSTYSSWNGYIKGKTHQLVKDKMIVQSWRSSDFKTGDMDSTLVIWFEKKGKDAVLNMTHANVPDHQYHQVKNGWNQYYWKPWKKYISTR